MDLRHCHRDAAGDAGNRQQDQERARRQVDLSRSGAAGFVEGSRRRRGVFLRRRSPEQERKRHHGGYDDDGDHDIGRPPVPGVHQCLDDQRPDRSADIVAAGAHRDGDAAAAAKPVRYIGDQRAERRRHADADQHALQQREYPDIRGEGGPGEPDRHGKRCGYRGNDNPQPVDIAPDQNIPEAEADHGQGIGDRCVGAVDGEFGLDRRQDHDHTPEPDAADRAKPHRDGKPHPRVAAVDQVFRRRLGSGSRNHICHPGKRCGKLAPECGEGDAVSHRRAGYDEAKQPKPSSPGRSQ